MSSQNQTALVSTAVGGIPVSADLAPSIVFILLYALLLPAVFYKFFIRKPRAWNVIQLSSILLMLERIAVYTIRAVQAAHAGKRSIALNYLQTSIGVGFVGISSESVKLLRALLVNTTLPEKGASKDRPLPRLRYRVFCIILELSFLASTIPGGVAGAKYRRALNNQALADKNMRLLYASSGVALGLELVLICVCLMAAFRVREVNRKRCFELAALTLLTTLIPIYRLSVLHIRTDNAFSPLSGSSRALFYIFHLVPEWLCVCILLGTNVRSRFGTGKWGDHELTDRKRNKRMEQQNRESEQERINEPRIHFLSLSP